MTITTNKQYEKKYNETLNNFATRELEQTRELVCDLRKEQSENGRYEY